MQLPGPVRAYVGLLASAADEAKRLPDRAVEFPMLAVSTALQMSLRAQQRYARLTARGDAVLHRRETTDEPPPWATFDDPLADDPLADDPLADDPLADGAVGDESLGTTGAAVDRVNGSTPSDIATEPDVDEVFIEVIDEVIDSDGARPTTGRSKPGKRVNAPRHTKPSRFDAVGDDPADR